MVEIVKVLFDERNARLQGESSNPPKDDGDHEENTPKGNGGNGGTPPPSPPYSSSSIISELTPISPKEHGKTITHNPLLKLDIKLKLPMYNGDVNA